MQIRSAGLSFSIGPQKTENTLKKTARELQKIIERISTSTRINSAADDAAGLSISEELRNRIRGFKSAATNIEDSISAFNIADNAANSIMDILQRQRELAIKAQNATLNDTNRAALDTEYQSLTQEIARISSSTQFNRQKVGNGEDLSSGDAVIQSGPDATDQIIMPKINFSAQELGIQGTSITTLSNAQSALSSIDDALKVVNSQRSTLGAFVNRLESSVNNLSVAMINTQAAESVIRDQDMAMGLVALTREQLLHEGSIKAFSRFKSMSTNHILGLLS
ncbi:MAG: flagellin [Fibrobacter sp.]|nr:flagellin [Fibrobacter sp.]